MGTMSCPPQRCENGLQSFRRPACEIGNQHHQLAAPRDQAGGLDQSVRACRSARLEGAAAPTSSGVSPRARPRGGKVQLRRHRLVAADQAEGIARAARRSGQRAADRRRRVQLAPCCRESPSTPTRRPAHKTVIGRLLLEAAHIELLERVARRWRAGRCGADRDARAARRDRETARRRPRCVPRCAPAWTARTAPGHAGKAGPRGVGAIGGTGRRVMARAPSRTACGRARA